MIHPECLPTEIWLKIFSYLHPRDNIRAFSNLNRFFDRFASTKYFGIHHHLSQSECISNRSSNSVSRLPLETFQSLSVGHRYRRSFIHFLHSNADRLIHLRKILVYLRKDGLDQSLIYLINALERLPSLKMLEIRSTSKHLDDRRLKNLLEMVLGERLFLTFCRLIFPLRRCDLHGIQWSSPSSIRHLTLKHISWSNLLLILSQTPNLITLEISTTNSEFQASALTLFSLRKIVLDIDRTSFCVLEGVRQLAPHLKSFVVEGTFSTDDENFFRENLWKKLLHQILSYRISIVEWICREKRKVNSKRFNIHWNKRHGRNLQPAIFGYL